MIFLLLLLSHYESTQIIHFRLSVCNLSVIDGQFFLSDVNDIFNFQSQIFDLMSKSVTNQVLLGTDFFENFLHKDIWDVKVASLGCLLLALAIILLSASLPHENWLSVWNVVIIGGSPTFDLLAGSRRM